jgi:autotransporter-associated beta strand protein
MKISSLRKALFLSVAFLSFVLSKAQNLTISSSGQTGTSGTNWTITGNSLSVTGTANINASVIAAHLNGNNDLLLTGNTATVTINVTQAITSSSLSNLIIGSSTNVGNVTISAAVSVGGELTINGTDISLAAALSTTSNGKALKLLAKNQVYNTASSSFTTQTGLILISSDVDNSAAGNIYFPYNLTVTSNGGDITFAGGDINGSGFARGFGTLYEEGIDIRGVLNVQSVGGNIIFRGKSDIGDATGQGIYGVGIWEGSTNKTINSGTGTIYIEGYSYGTNTTEDFNYGVTFDGATVTITSANTSANAIVIKGSNYSGGATGSALIDGRGIDIRSTNTKIYATGIGGSIKMDAQGYFGFTLYGNLEILANSGTIELNNVTSGGSTDFYLNGNLWLGSKAATPVSTSSTSITLRGNDFNFTGNYPLVATTGVFTLEPCQASSAFGQSVNNNWFTWNSNSQVLSQLVIGKVGNTADIVFGAAQIVDGPISLYGGNVSIDQNLTATASGAAILLQATKAIDIAASKTVQSNAGNITLRSNSAGAALSAASSIILNSGSTLKSQGGNITLGGNFTGLQGAGLYAASTNAPAVLIDGGILTAAGGNIKIYGKCSGSYDDGIRLRGNITTTGSGNIELYGEAHGGNNGSTYFGGITFGTLAGSTIETENGNLILDGYLTNTQNNNTGAINFYRSGGSTGQTKHINLLSKTGNVTVKADRGTTGAFGIGHSSWGHVYVGSPASGWTATGNVVFTYSSLVGAGYNGIKVKTTGAVTYQPVTASFAAAQVLPSNIHYVLAQGASSLTIGSTTNTANIDITSALSIAGPIAIYGGLLEIEEDITSTAGANITLSGSAGFYTQGSSAIQRDITTAGGNILIEADRDANGIGTLNLDYLVVNPGSGNTIIRGEDYNWVTTSEATKPWINGTGTFTLESNDVSIGQELWMQWFKINQDGNNLTGLNIGKTTNAHHVYFSSVGGLTINGPVNVHGVNVGVFVPLTILNNTLSIKSSGTAYQSAAIVTPNLALNGTGIFTLTNLTNNIGTVAGGGLGNLLGATEIIDASGGLTIGTVGTNVGLTGSSTIKVETLTSNLTLEANINTTSTSSNAVILTAAKNTAIGVGTGGDILIAGTPTITMGTGGIAKLFSGLEETSTGLTTFVGGSNNVRNNFDETSASITPALTANNRYAIYRTLPSVGDLTIVATGGHVLGPTWTYANGIISTISTPVLINVSDIQNYLSNGPLTIGAGNITISTAISSTAANALVFTSNGLNTITVNAAISLASSLTFNSNHFVLGEAGNISTSTAADITFNLNANFSTTNGARRTITSANGNIILHADKDANSTGTVDIDYLTFNPGTGTTIIRTSLFNFSTGASAGPYINGTGAFVCEPSAPSFGQQFNLQWFQIDQDNNGISSLTLGKLGNTANIIIDANISIAGPVTAYGAYVGVSHSITSTASGDIFLKGTGGGNDVEVSSTISKTAGTGTLTIQSNGRAHFSGAVSATGSAILNVVLWSDYDGDNGDGGATFSGPVSTNGGHVWMGGSNSNGGSYTWNGLTVGDGPSVGGSNANALDFYNSVTTNGGDVFVWAGNGNGGTNGIASNGNWIINTGSGDIALVAPSTSGTIQLTTTGAISLVPNGGAYPAAQTLGGTLTSGNYTFNTGFYSGLVINNVSQVASLTFGRNADLLTAGTPYVLGNSSGLTLSSALQFGGAVQLYGGTITLNSNLSTTNTSTGNISLNGTTIAGTGNISIAEGRTLTMNVTNTSTYDGIISGTGSGLTKTGAGLLTLTKDHLYTGSTTISGGELQVGTGGSVSQASSGTISETSGVAIASGSKLILAPNENMTFSRAISGEGNIEIKGASGAYYNSFLTSTYATFATNTTVLEVLTRITGGMQQGQAITGQKTAGAYLKSYNAASNTATLQLQNYDGQLTKCVFVQLAQSGTDVQIKGNTSIYGGAANRSGNQLGADMSTGSTAIAGGLATSASAAGYGISNVYMSGKVNFTGALTYTGTTLLSNTITSGTGSNTFSYTSKGTQEIKDGSSSFPAASTVINNGLVIFNRSTAGTIASNLEGTEEVLQVGAPISLTGTCTHSGLTTVDLNKSLSIGSGGTTGIMTGNILNYGTVTFNRADQSTYPGVISGTGSLVKTGAGELILTGLQDFSGATTISAGKLTIERNVPAYSASVISGAGELAIQPASSSFTNAVSYPIAGIGVSSAIGGLTLGKDGNTATISIEAATSVAGPLKVYAGELALNAAVSTTNTSTGDILFKINTLSGVQSITVADSRSLTFDIVQDLVNGSIINGTNMTLIKAGAGTFTRSSVLPSGISLTTDAGVLELDMSIDAQNLTLNGGTLRNKAGHTLTLNGSLSSVAGATLENNGTMTIVGPSTFPGVNTTVSAMNNLRINKQTGVTLDEDLTVTGELNLLLGNLDLGTKTLTLGGSVTLGAGKMNATTGVLAFANQQAPINLPIGLFTTTNGVNVVNELYKSAGSASVLIQEDMTVTGALRTTSGTGELVFGSAIELNMDGDFINNGTLTFDTLATVLQGASSQASGSGIYNVKQKVTGSSANGQPNGRFWYLGSAVANAQASAVLSPITNKIYHWEANQANPNWIDVTDPNAVLATGKGYSLRMGATGVLNFSGTALNNSNIQVASYRQTTGSFQGFNLISNPYLSYLDWETVWQGSNAIHFQPTIWYRLANNTNVMVFDTYNAQSNIGTSNNSANGSTSVTRYIPPMQAVWMRLNPGVSSANLVLDNAARSHYTAVQGGLTAGLKSTAQDFPAFVRLNLIQGSFQDQTIVYLKDAAAASYDDFDSDKMFLTGYPQVYSQVAGKKLVINGLKDNKKVTVVPLFVDIPAAGNYTFKASELNIENGLILLEDKLEGVLQDLTINDTYQFAAASGTISNRFYLRIILPNNQPIAQGPVSNWVNEEVSFTEGGSILVSSDGAGKVIVSQQVTELEEGFVLVRDAAGRLVFEGSVSGEQTIFTLEQPSGLYFVEVQIGNTSQVEKILLR